MVKMFKINRILDFHKEALMKNKKALACGSHCSPKTKLMASALKTFDPFINVGFHEQSKLHVTDGICKKIDLSSRATIGGFQCLCIFNDSLQAQIFTWSWECAICSSWKKIFSSKPSCSSMARIDFQPAPIDWPELC